MTTTLSTPFPTRIHRPGRAVALLAAGVALIVMLGVLLSTLTNGAGHDPSGGAGFLTEPLPTATVTAAPTSAPDAAAVTLENLSRIRYELQTWNNQGPAALGMALSYYGWTGGQSMIQRELRPNPEDKDVTPWEMAEYVNDHTGQRALTRSGGTMTLLRDLVAADFPVIVRTSIQPEGEGWMGHWMLLVAYNDDTREFLAFDSYMGNNNGAGRPMLYSVFDEQWRHFARTFVVVYQPDQEGALLDLLGDYTDPRYGYEVVLERARAAASADEDDKWAWFNMGTAYAALGQYDNAATAYDQALQQNLPFRMLWYQYGPFEAYYEVEQYGNVRALAEITLTTTPYVEELYFWQGLAYTQLGYYDSAYAAWQQISLYNSNFDARQAFVLPRFAGDTTYPPATASPPSVVLTIEGIGEIERESVTLQNQGEAVDLLGWTLQNDKGDVFEFPDVELPRGGRVTVYSRQGTNMFTELYWGRDVPVWQPGDTVILADAFGAIQALYTLAAE